MSDEFQDEGNHTTEESDQTIEVTPEAPTTEPESTEYETVEDVETPIYATVQQDTYLPALGEDLVRSINILNTEEGKAPSRIAYILGVSEDAVRTAIIQAKKQNR